MQTIEIILSITGIIGYLASTYFAVSTYFSLCDMKKKVKALEVMEVTTLAKTTCLELMIIDLKIEKTKDKIDELVANEEYEKAESLNEVLVDMRKSVENIVASFNREFGEFAMLKMVGSKEYKERTGENDI